MRWRRQDLEDVAWYSARAIAASVEGQQVRGGIEDDRRRNQEFDTDLAGIQYRSVVVWNSVQILLPVSIHES